MGLKSFNPEKELKKLNRKYTKKHLIMSLISLVLLISIGSSYAIFSIQPEYHTFIKGTVGEFSTGDILLSVLVEGEKRDEFPAKGSGYVFESVTCENGTTGTWDKEKWGLQATFTKTDKCVLSFIKDITPPTLEIKIENTEWGRADVYVTADDSDSTIKTIRYYLDDELEYEGLNKYYTITDINAGTHNFKVECEDYAGNIAVAEEDFYIVACFIAGTLVLTDDGLVPIEEIKVDDYVYTINRTTNQKELKRVKGTIKSETYTIYKLTINDEEIYASPRHPFYVVDKGYTEAYNLKKGDLLLSTNGVKKIANVEILEYQEPIPVYNLEVEGNHNFLVTKDGYLVHNSPYS